MKDGSKEKKDETFEKIKENLIYEKNLDEETINKNKDKVLSLRFFSTVFTGMVAGILGLTGLFGLGFYLVSFLFVSVLLFLHIKKQKGNFATSILSLLFEGFVDHGMTYTIFWVLFYNLVYIYS